METIKKARRRSKKSPRQLDLIDAIRKAQLEIDELARKDRPAETPPADAPQPTAVAEEQPSEKA